MNIQLLNPVLQNSSFQSELEDAALSVLRSGQYILGPAVTDFETAAAKYLGVKECIGVSSGTDALLISLMALGIGPGDEVICPSFTFFATAGSIARTGANPIFVDVYDDTFNINPALIEDAISKHTRAIIPVHLFGQSADMSSILQLAVNYSLHVIEDSAQAIGAEYNGARTGSMGTTGCFSFFPSKNLGGFGDGGLVSTNDTELASKIRMLRNHGVPGRGSYDHNYLGGNFKMDSLQAALLNVKLKHLPEMESSRSRHARIYKDVLSDTNMVLPVEEHKHVWNQFTIKYNSRDKLKEYLSTHGIPTAIYYPRPLHRQPCFLKMNIIDTNISLPVTDSLCNKCLSLPISSELTDEQITFIAETIRDYE